MAESHPASREIEAVRQLIDSVRAGEVQDPIVLAEAQERGFGALMSLEAQLQRTQRAHGETTAAPVVAPGADGDREALTEAIHELAHVLSELRGLASPAGGPSRAGYGFVLPGRRVTGAHRPMQA